MTDKKVRWGILSCAQIAINAIIPAIQRSSNAEVAAISSRDLDKAQSFATKLNIPKAYGSYEEILADDSIDAVYIPLPNHMHKEWTIRAAEAGKHILCEKPFAMDAFEAAEMVAACKKHNVVLAEAFMYRYHPRYETIQNILRSGEIGEIRGVQVAFSFHIYDVGAEGNIRMDPTMGGGALFDVGCYTVSGARLVIGQEPEAATAQALYLPEHDTVDMMVSGLVEFPNSVGLSFQCGMWSEFRNTLQIAGSEGRLDIPSAYVPAPEDADFRVLRKGEWRDVTVPVVDAYQCQMEDISRTILEGSEPRFAAEDAILNMRVLDALRSSAKQRARILI